MTSEWVSSHLSQVHGMNDWTSDSLPSPRIGQKQFDNLTFYDDDDDDDDDVHCTKIGTLAYFNDNCD